MNTQPEVDVGRRIRALRERQNLSLRALAERSSLSTTAISQIERGDNSPTVSSLHLLASALGVTIAELFKDDRDQAVVLVKPGERLRTEARGVTMESLGLGLPYQQIEPFLVTVAPGVDNADQPVTHAGEEFVYCLSGTVEYCVAGETYRMEPGASLVFEATRPHFLRNVSDEDAQLIMVFLAGGRHLAHRLHTATGKTGPGR